MNFFRKSRPAIEYLFRGFTSNTPKPTPQPNPNIPIRTQFRQPFFSGISRFHSPTSSSSSKASLAGRRFYYVDRRQVQHFRRKGRWYANPRAVIVVVAVGSATLVTIYFGNLEAVPYTNRKHFVLLSRDMERKLGEAQFQELKASLKDKILPAAHPDSIRVRLISKRIIEALERGLGHETKAWTDLEYASEVPVAGVVIADGTPDTIWALSDVRGRSSEEVKWSHKDEVLDDEWVQESRKKKGAHSPHPATQHLEGLNWEILVVRNPLVNAMCLPGGKIVVFTGLFDHFRTDPEIATVIGHEIGHAVARHTVETITKNLWFAILQLILLQFFYMPDVINAMSNLLLKLPFSRRMEIEADYIGLLLMASAGYDPQVAPKVYEKLGEITGDSVLNDYLSTHPSSKKRAQMLSQAKVMEEALAIYREEIAGHGVQGFFL